MATPGVIPVAGRSMHAARGRRRCQAARFASSTPTPPRSPTCRNSASSGLYNGAYGDNIHIFGITLAKSIYGVSVGAELSYRQNMPLASDPVQVLPAAFVPLVPGSIATTAVPSSGTPGALGDTMHGLINGINIFPKTALFDTATLSGELTWMQWSSVTQNEAVFKGRSGYTAIDKPTKNFFGLAINFTPTWFQVWPGVDLFAPVTWSQASPATPRSCSAAARTAATGVRVSPPTSTRSTGST